MREGCRDLSMERALMVHGITDAFGTREPRRFAQGRRVRIVERAIRARVEPRLWPELPLGAGVDFCEEEI